MIRDDLYIQVERKKTSYDFKLNAKLDSFKNNIKNNAVDTIKLYQNDKEIFIYEKIRSLLNYPGCKVADSLANGNFQIKCFVDRRSYKENIHGIINAFDMEGQKIDSFSMQKDNGLIKGRWLVHGNLNPKTNRDYNYCWSQGCIIFFETKKLEEFNTILKNIGVLPGDIINCKLLEVE